MPGEQTSAPVPQEAADEVLVALLIGQPARPDDPPRQEHEPWPKLNPLLPQTKEMRPFGVSPASRWGSSITLLGAQRGRESVSTVTRMLSAALSRMRLLVYYALAAGLIEVLPLGLLPCDC
jgi:hypothetical protein